MTAPYCHTRAMRRRRLARAALLAMGWASAVIVGTLLLTAATLRWLG